MFCYFRLFAVLSKEHKNEKSGLWPKVNARLKAIGAIIVNVNLPGMWLRDILIELGLSSV